MACHSCLIYAIGVFLLSSCVHGWLSRFHKNPSHLLFAERLDATKTQTKFSVKSMPCLGTVSTTALYMSKSTASDEKGHLLRRNRYFSPEEDDLLLQAIRDCQTTKQAVSWSKIAAALGNRDKEQYRRRWHRLIDLHPDKVSSILEDKIILFRRDFDDEHFWTKDEDDKLLASLQAFQIAKRRVSWQTIARNVGSKDRVQCSSRWSYLAFRSTLYQDKIQDIQKDNEWLFRDPDSDWTEQENALFLQTLREFQAARKKVSHVQLAEILGTRDAQQCAHRWKHLTDHKPETIADILPDKDILFLAAGDKFTSQEDERLLKAIRGFQFPSPQVVCWKEVARIVETRERTQCFSRWNELVGFYPDKVADILVDKNILFPWRTGKFSAEEDEKLFQGIRDCQEARRRVSWDKIAKIVGTRTHSQCFGRWKSLQRLYSAELADILVDKDVLFRKRSSKVRFTVEEDKKMQEAIREFQIAGLPVDWAEVARKMDGSRDKDQCRKHWVFYVKYHASQVADILEDKDVLFPPKKSAVEEGLD
ncbi:hypothetical protein EON65_34005 [archaeon]|nr:MAG: hypothetical protein EON65_34005 [archaeon]